MNSSANALLHKMICRTVMKIKKTKPDLNVEDIPMLSVIVRTNKSM